jgi:hypothetical protein
MKREARKQASPLMTQSRCTSDQAEEISLSDSYATETTVVLEKASLNAPVA